MVTDPLAQTIPAPATSGMSPPMPEGGGFSPAGAPAMPPVIPIKPRKGGLPIGVIASIQGVYAKEEQKQQALAGMEKPLELKPGWGGQGR